MARVEECMSVSKALWDHVVTRDAYMIWGSSGSHLPFRSYMARLGVVCIVRLLMPDQIKDCAGRTTVDHVKDELGMGMKAPDDEWHLTAACEYHNVWHPPSKALRAAQRTYLADCKRAAAEQGGSSDGSEVEEPA